MENKLISLIIPVYNTSKYLRECLDSVINQSYKNLEIIIINDGSTDNSLDIINEYKEKDGRIKVLDIPNSGGGNARNKGLDIATGDYIGFVDSDDSIELKMYEIMMKEIIKNNVEMSICDYSLSSTFDINKPIKETIMDNHTLMKELLKDETITSHFWRKLYPAKVFKTNRFNNRKVVHDMSLDHILLKEINSAVYFDAPLYIYRQTNPTNLSNTNALKLESSLNRAKVMIDRIEFTKKYYPDLTNILVNKAAMFIMSSYAKLTLIYKDNKEDKKYLEDYLNANLDLFLKDKDTPKYYKVVLYAINHHLKPIVYIASKYYIHGLQHSS